MATANHVLLRRITLSASASSVTFDSIPQTGYTDLKIVVSSRSDRADTNDFLKISFNGLTTNLSHKSLSGDGTSANSGSDGSFIYGRLNGNTSTANTFGNAEFYIPNYTSAVAKSVSGDTVMENNATYSVAYMLAGLWNSTAAITSVTLAAYYGNLLAGSSFSLYGIANAATTPALAPKADGGDIIKTDGTYWYHAFLASGTFKPQVNLTCDYLVVAGGGAGGATEAGSNYSGGGGAGGLRSTVTATGGGGSLESAISTLSTTTYTVTVGAGGAASAALWNSGSDSSFSTITSIGGGKGGGINTNPNWISSATGGSGGGGDEASPPGAAGTSGQGYAGGSSPGGPSGNSGGGGGGAGAVGGNGTQFYGGAGGAGVAISVFASATGTGVSNYYAGGGGAAGEYGNGAGGAGGGGAGNTVAGTANTGGGGGAGARSGAAGGSGIVIIRYPV